MTTINVTIPTGKPGKVAVFTIEFQVSKFDEVIEAVSTIKTISEIQNFNLWEVK